MAKKFEENKHRHLYSTWLDVLWAHHDAAVHVKEQQSYVKDTKKRVAECRRSIKAVREHYFKVYGEYPTLGGVRRDRGRPGDPFEEKK